METRRRKKSRIVSDGPCSTPWDNLGADILVMIFKNLPLGDRVRVGAVCRKWNLALSRAKHDILGIPEAPWRILTDDFHNSQFLTEVGFKSLSDGNIYRFFLPENRDIGWFCGSSRGWLLMAGGNRKSYYGNNPDLFLWNPLNGSTRDLPPLSARADASIMSLFDRVHVFSHSSAECVVAVILNRHVCRKNRISLCTPRDERWTTFGAEEDTTTYIDVEYLEKTGSLWLLAKKADPHPMAEQKPLRSQGRVSLPSGCTVPISFCYLDRPFREADIVYDQINLPRTSLTLKNARQVFRLVEDTVHEDGDVLIVATGIDRQFRVRYANKEAMVYDRTGRVSVIVPYDGGKRSEELTAEGIENRAVFLGSSGTDSIVVSNRMMKGIETDCVYLAIEDSHGYRYHYDNAGRKSACPIQEQGVYCLKSNKMRSYTSSKVNYFPLLKSGWFEPKIFLK